MYNKYMQVFPESERSRSQKYGGHTKKTTHVGYRANTSKYSRLVKGQGHRNMVDTQKTNTHQLYNKYKQVFPESGRSRSQKHGGHTKDPHIYVIQQIQASISGEWKVKFTETRWTHKRPTHIRYTTNTSKYSRIVEGQDHRNTVDTQKTNTYPLHNKYKQVSPDSGGQDHKLVFKLLALALEYRWLILN